jgi:Flp pilus assembly pilin Flp
MQTSKQVKLTKLFCNDESGQDLTEYALMLAFVVLSSAAIFLVSGDIIKGIWYLACSILSNGSSCASAGS